MIRARAPGKVVLWGEYAVLTGAPALVQAVDRYAVCTLIPGGSRWQCSARGFDAAPAGVSAETLMAENAPPADAVWALLWQVCRSMEPEALPEGMRADLDTESFHHQGTKLGLGSSAALTVAIYAALARLLHRDANFDGALAAHGRLQAGGTGSPIRSGSGIDVAAAWYGGLLRYRRDLPGAPGEVDSWHWPEPVHLVHVWTGVAARTSDHLARLERYLASGSASELSDLAGTSERLFQSTAPLAALAGYVQALRELDAAAGLGVFSPAHDALAQLAKGSQVVYKPCGAGGGDVGVGFTGDRDAAARFARQAADLGFLPLALETASHGIQVAT